MRFKTLYVERTGFKQFANVKTNIFYGNIAVIRLDRIMYGIEDTYLCILKKLKTEEIFKHVTR